MGFAFRLMIFVVGFNLAIGIFIAVFGANNWNSSFDVTNTGNDAYQGINQTQALFDTYNQTSSVPVEEASFWYRFLDIISLGFYNKIKHFLDVTIFSIPTMIARLSPSAGVLIPSLKAIITIIFVIGMFELFTGKALENR
jgi:hypothetical protein